jgi:hypothetical protein
LVTPDIPITQQIITISFSVSEVAIAMPEKRTKPRFDVCLDVRWQGSATHYNVRIADISEGGCYVDTILEVTKGETLFLRLLFPDGIWLELEGIVAHHSPQLGFGVRFVNLSDKQLSRVRGLIAQFAPEAAQAEPAWQVEKIDISCHEVM